MASTCRIHGIFNDLQGNPLTGSYRMVVINGLRNSMTDSFVPNGSSLLGTLVTTAGSESIDVTVPISLDSDGVDSCVIIAINFDNVPELAKFTLHETDLEQGDIDISMRTTDQEQAYATAHPPIDTTADYASTITN